MKNVFAVVAFGLATTTALAELPPVNVPYSTPNHPQLYGPGPNVPYSTPNHPQLYGKTQTVDDEKAARRAKRRAKKAAKRAAERRARHDTTGPNVPYSTPNHPQLYGPGPNVPYSTPNHR